MRDKDETIGTLLAIAALFLIGINPILSKFAVDRLNPLFLGATYTLMGLFIPALFAWKRGEIKDVFKKENLPIFLLIVFLANIISTIIRLYGTRSTSGINSSILLQTETVYAFILSHLLLKEAISSRQIMGAVSITSGVILVMYNGTLSFNLGDVLVAISPLFIKLSHVIIKKISQRLSTYTILTARFLYGGLFLLLASTLFGQNQFELLLKPINLATVVALGVFVASLGVISFYESMRRINLSKATALIAPYPVISVMLAWPLLGETPNTYQLIGLSIVLVGMYITIRVKPRKPN